MSGSNMFVVYTSADGKNVTLSPRSSSGYDMPTLNSDVQVELLEGSGVSNGIMTANVKCELLSMASLREMLIRERLELQQLVRRYSRLQSLKRKLDLCLSIVWRCPELE